MTDSFPLDFGRETDFRIRYTYEFNNTIVIIGNKHRKLPSNTKNHPVRNVPMARRTVARCGNTDGFMGEMCLASVASILINMATRISILQYSRNV